MVGLAIAPYHKNGEKEQLHLVTLTDELLWSSALVDVSRPNLRFSLNESRRVESGGHDLVSVEDDLLVRPQSG